MRTKIVTIDSDRLKKKYKKELLNFYNRYFTEESNKKVIANTQIFFALMTSNEIIGACRVLTDFSRQATLFDLIVRKFYRNNKIGTKLTKRAINYCKKEKINKLILTTDPRHTWLTDFYIKTGFSKVDNQILMMITF